VGERFTSSELDLEIQFLSLNESGTQVVVYFHSNTALSKLKLSTPIW
jgi:hypothetical protein